jgi:dihydropteroate synthase type 2
MQFTRSVIVGVVNVTEDSFSDGGRYLEPRRALEHARGLAASGADIVELGAASSNPDAKRVPPEEEISRLQPLLDDLATLGITISVDSFQAETHRYCARRGDVAIINDVQGFPESESYPDLARASCKLVVMHSVAGRARPARAPAESRPVIEGMYRFFEARLRALESAGIARSRLILDPGMGYFLASNPEPSLMALREIPKLKASLGLPVLISVSRKSFIGTLTGRPVQERGAGSLAAELFAAIRGVDYIRTHEPAALRDAITVFGALINKSGEPLPGPDSV